MIGRNPSILILVLFFFFQITITVAIVTKRSNIAYKDDNNNTRISINDQDNILSKKYKSRVLQLSKRFPLWFIIDNDGVKTTRPYSDGQLAQLVKQFYLPDITEENAALSCFESEQCAKNWLKDFNFIYQRFNEKLNLIEFNKSVDDKLNNDQTGDEQSLKSLYAKFDANSKRVAKLFLINSQIWSPSLKRSIYLISRGPIFNSERDLMRHDQLQSLLSNRHVDVDDDDHLSSHARRKTSRNYTELLQAWKNDSAANQTTRIRLFQELVNLKNKAAQSNAYADYSELMSEQLEQENRQFDRTMEKLFKEFKPFYDLLHAYVRRRLNKFYNQSSIDNNDNNQYIKAHLVGGSGGDWASQWDWKNIYDLVKPFPDRTDDYYDAWQRSLRNYTHEAMLLDAEKFFTSMGLFTMTPTFWKHSLQSAAASGHCSPASFDLMNSFDFRVRICNKTSGDDDDHFNEYLNVHREIAHVQYSMAYRQLPAIFRESSIPAFRQAIGNAVCLAVMTPAHLRRLSSRRNIVDESDEQDINYLMRVALHTMPVIAHSYMLYKWRSNVFNGNISSSGPDDYSTKWWQLRQQFEGIDSPLTNQSSNVYFDIDTVADFTMPSFSNYFLAQFLEFQFYEALCKTATRAARNKLRKLHYQPQPQSSQPLFKCDFSNSKEAGAKLKKMMALARKRHWTYVLKLLTGRKSVSVRPLMNYFKPLKRWLIKYQSKQSI